jgi:hypothetical protein
MTERYRCNLCSLDYLWKTGLQKHKRQKHKNDPNPKKSYQCLCQKKFVTCDALEKHLSKVDGWKCTECLQGCHSPDEYCCSEARLIRVNESEDEQVAEEPLPVDHSPPIIPQTILPPLSSGMTSDIDLEYSRDSVSYENDVALYASGNYYHSR